MAKNRKKGVKSKEDSNKDSKGNNAPQSTAIKSPEPKAKPKTAAERKKVQIDGIKKTVYPSVLGVAGGFVCFYSPSIISQLPGLSATVSPNSVNLLPWHFVLLVLIGITYLIQKMTYPFLGIDVTAFKAKDWFYVEFMAVDLWLVTWTLLLN
jgi:EMC6-arch